MTIPWTYTAQMSDFATMTHNGKPLTVSRDKLPTPPAHLAGHVAAVQEVFDKLAALGTAEQIAMFLADQGITGMRAESDMCPIAQYVNREVPEARTTVGRSAFGVRGPNDARWNTFTLPTPAPVDDFVVAFDNREFPDLIDTDAETAAAKDAAARLVEQLRMSAKLTTAAWTSAPLDSPLLLDGASDVELQPLYPVPADQAPVDMAVLALGFDPAACSTAVLLSTGANLHAVLCHG